MSNNDGEFNYSVGVLIILLLLFWFVCKCTCSKKEPMGDLYYGDTPIHIGTPNGVRYIYSTGKKVIVPNSQTAMRRLFDENAYKCQTLDTLGDTDSKPSKVMEVKQRSQNHADKKRPASMTATRENMCCDRDMRVPMPSY